MVEKKTANKSSLLVGCVNLPAKLVSAIGLEYKYQVVSGDGGVTWEDLKCPDDHGSTFHYNRVLKGKYRHLFWMIE